MRALVFAILNVAIIAGMATAQQAELTFPLQQELTLQEFIRFEKAKGASIETYDPEFFVITTEEVYPYAKKYEIAQPFHGSRVVDSTEVSFECYFTQADSVVKYISYNLGHAELNFPNALEQLKREGRTSREDIDEAIQQLNNDPRIPRHSMANYRELKKYFAGQLGEPTSIPNEEEIVEHSRLSWQKENLHVLLAYVGNNRRKGSVLTRIYWE